MSGKRQLALKIQVGLGDADFVLLRLREGRFMIGRAQDCNIRVSSGYVSKTHAVVICEKGDCSIQDLNSTNGTLLNSKLITKQEPIVTGDEIFIGPVKIFVIESPAAEEAGVSNGET